MSNERELAKDMMAELKRHGIEATYQDYEARKARLIDLNDGFHQLLDFIPDFIMIDLLKEYEVGFLNEYSNIDELVDGILGYKHGYVQLMRKIARHFFVFNSHTKEFELDKNFEGYTASQLEKMARWSKPELLKADINPSMTVFEIDAKVRENGLKRSLRVTDDEYSVITAYSNADAEVKEKVRVILNLKKI
ncbi:hypothetical protein [Butyrivibrio sp. AE2015]|uniref:hypothetical protein n=1 Tax=Butyrivibrio sp. AE2015 TaxID=1280663 RepID=UPI0003B4A5C5|nr:hypothetical protein [Butyrivibrio sp. AE2015]